MEGSLINLLDFFISKDCSSILGGLYTEPSFENLNIIKDKGRIQSAIASSMTNVKGTSFYVNARRENDTNLFKYETTASQEENLYHYRNDTEKGNNCLVYKVDAAGDLVTEGVNCEDEFHPLCGILTQAGVDIIEDKCRECDPDVYENKCKEWVNLAMLGKP